MKHLRSIITCLALLGLLSGCTATQYTGLASYSDPDDESGIGGTGIIGAITGFGSIFVNGVEVEVGRGTRLSVDGQAVDAVSFARGDVVEILAVKQRGDTYASQVNIRHEVIGTVTAVDNSKRRFTVLGQTVINATQHGDLPRAGASVQVSGFRDAAGRIHATRVTRASAENLLLRGETRTSSKGAFYIGKQKVIAGDNALPPAGTRVQVRGHLRGNALEASSLTVLDTPPFGNKVRRLLVQGFPNKESGQAYRIDRVTFLPAPDSPGMLQSRQTQPLRMEIQRSASGAWTASRLINERGLTLGRPDPRLDHGKAGHTPAIPHRPSMPPRPGMGGAGRPMR